MAEGGEPVILEEYLLLEDAPLLEEMAEEDEELDLYNEMTFGLDRDSTEEDTTQPLMLPEMSPELAQVMAKETETMDALEPEQLEELEKPLEEGGMEPEVEQVGAELEEEELRTEDQEENEEPCEEPNDLGDPAVMKAVQSKPTLESQDSAVLDSRIDACWAEFSKEEVLEMEPTVWGSCPSSVPSHHVLQDKAIVQVLERPPSSPSVAFSFLSSPMQRDFGGSPRLKHSNLRLTSPKSFPQRFLQQQPPLVPPRSPHSFAPARRPSPLLALNQSTGYSSPSPFRPVSPSLGSPAQPLAMHFGPMSPSVDPALLFSPSASSQLSLSMPSHMTQLHPQHQRLLTQRQQQGGQAQSTCSSKKLWCPEADPYGGLMTSKEKDWVVKVEMIQLQSENMDDDFYYQTYYHRLEHKQAEEKLFGGRNKQEPPKLVTPFIQKVETYDSVVRIAGSLGQVAVSTCYSPRRAIDAVHHALVEEAAGSHRLRALHRIEKLFLQLLQVEEMQRKMALALEKQQQPCCQEQKNQEVESIYQGLRIRACSSSEEEAEDEFLQLLCVRKGKKLIARLLPHLAWEQAEKILLTIAHHLPFLMKKDLLDESLPVLYSPLDKVVAGTGFSKLIEVLQEIIRPLPESAELPLSMALKNQFGISLLYSLLSQGERLLSSEAPLEPRAGDFETWTDMVFLVARELAQVPKASLVEPLFLPSNLISLFCRYLDKQTIHHLEAKMECSQLPSGAAMPC